jgi:transcriptional regulator with XRE-family HTH domain
LYYEDGVALEILERIGAIVANRRAELCIGQQVLADRSGLHRTYISDIEHGRRNITIGTLNKLASVLELSVSDLMRSAESPVIDHVVPPATVKFKQSVPLRNDADSEIARIFQMTQIS